MDKITPDILVNQLGFIHKPNLIQDSWELILENIDEQDEFINDRYYHYKSISLSMCNDKGKGEYYVFMREGQTNETHEDHTVTITRNMLYVEDLVKFIDILRL